MFKWGDVFQNPITGERATIRLGTCETKGERLVVDLACGEPVLVRLCICIHLSTSG